MRTGGLTAGCGNDGAPAVLRRRRWGAQESASASNVSLGNSNAWQEKARAHLCPRYRDVVLSLPVQDRSLTNAVIAIRNLLAHRSVKASAEMNEALRNLHGQHDRALRRGTRKIHPSGIGSYLNADQAGARRVEIYHARLRELAERLRTP